MARSGFVAKGVIYLLFGLLGAQAAFGAGRSTSSTQTVMLEVLAAPFGRLLLTVLAIGLAWYAIWRLFEAFGDANDKGSEVKGLGSRAVYLGSAAIYGALAIDAFAIVLRWDNESGTVRSIVNSLMTGWGARIAALVLIGYGLWQISRVVRGKLSSQLKEGEARREAGPWAITLSYIGVGGRGALFVVVGVWLLMHPGDAKAVTAGQTAAGSLRVLSRLPQGELFMACAALALMAYGAYMLVHARYRRINVPV
ncbi:MAG: DUF1206 domain-containing protein [Acidobacteriota bacterium]|nr:DUF1206 domain-containing protein [Acidobacteriota bacterium]